MTWETFYREYSGMSYAARVKMIRALRDFGMPDEITACACRIGPGEQADLLVERALQNGVTFDHAQILELAQMICASVLEKAIGKTQASDPPDEEKRQMLAQILEEKKSREARERLAQAQTTQPKKKDKIEGFHRPPEKRGINERFAILLGFLATVLTAAVILIIVIIVLAARSCS